MTHGYYSKFKPPRMGMSELVCKTLDHDATDVLIDKWLEHATQATSPQGYSDWFAGVRERKHHINTPALADGGPRRSQQALVWNKGDFVPENVFCRTVDTGRLIPLDRTWSTHVYHHRSLQDRKLSMMPVVFTMLPELMLLRGMHDHGCDDIYIIVTDLKRQEMEDVTRYFEILCDSTYHRFDVKPSIEKQIELEHMRLTHTLNRQRRTPCFPQIDLTFRAILYHKKPPFLILFSHQPASYSQIFFTHPVFVPAKDIFYDFPSGCPNPCCSDDCEMIRFPRHGPNTAAVLAIKRGGKHGGRRVKTRTMCNWIDCSVCFDDERAPDAGSTSGESAEGTEGRPEVGDTTAAPPKNTGGGLCSRCKMVRYCSREHMMKDFEEHRRMCRRS